MDIVEKIKIEARKQNLRQVRREIESAWLRTKIINHLTRHPYIKQDIEDIKRSILENDLTASFFMKDPSRQNITEKFFSNMIEKMDSVVNFKPSNVNTNTYLIGGEIMNVSERPIGLKSVDFIFEHKDRLFVVSQKHTTGEGGAQDNQFNDVVSFLRESIGLVDATPIALVDGTYYTNQKIEDLKKINSKAIVLSAFDLEEWLNE